jgi:hypothetical protein
MEAIFGLRLLWVAVLHISIGGHSITVDYDLVQHVTRAACVEYYRKELLPEWHKQPQIGVMAYCRQVLSPTSP